MNKLLLHDSIKQIAVLQFSRAGGPGGQNVNKVSSKVTLHIKLSGLAGLTEAELTHARNSLASRLARGKDSDGDADLLVLQCSEERSQEANRQIAYARAEALISGAARLPKRRRPTRPSRAARERRLEEKHLRSKIKALRAGA
jgi:ribosome-associated protein